MSLHAIVPGHARSIVVTLDDYSRLWREIAALWCLSSYIVHKRVSANVHLYTL